VPELCTPFRERYERSLGLSVQAQIEECADYLQHPAVLVAEFLESYYLVERKLDPDPLELRVASGSRVETIRCVAGAFAPLAGEVHPALERSGVDYVGVRAGSQRVVLGVTDPEGGTTPFSLLLRALNCLAELATPFQVARLRRHVLRDRLDPEGAFDLQIGIARGARSGLDTSLLVLTRDLAEVFKTRVSGESQFAGQIGRIECLEFDPDNATGSSLRLRWRA